MTQHITQEQAFEQWYVENAFNFEVNPIFSRDCGLQRKAWHAAIQWDRDKRKAELPVLPEWSKQDNLGGLVPSEIRMSMRDFGQQCAAHARELALDESKQAADNCDVVEAKGDTYYAQLGDAAATQRGIVAAIEALKGK